MGEAVRELGVIQFQQQELQDSRVSLERRESLKTGRPTQLNN